MIFIFSSFQYFEAFCKKHLIPLMHVGFEMITANFPSYMYLPQYIEYSLNLVYTKTVDSVEGAC